MKDRFFYPLLLIAIAVIIGLALLPGRGNSGKSPKDILREGFSLSGPDLQKLTVAPATLISFTSSPDGKTQSALLSTNIPFNMATPSAGIFATLGPNYEKAFGGHKLKITLTARQARDNPLTEFKAGYFTGGVGNSGWHRFTLSPTYQAYSFTYHPNPPKSKPGNDYLGVWPGDAGDGKQMELKSMQIEVIDLPQ